MKSHFEVVLSLLNIKQEEKELLSYVITMYILLYVCPLRNNIPNSQVRTGVV